MTVRKQPISVTGLIITESLAAHIIVRSEKRRGLVLHDKVEEMLSNNVFDKYADELDPYLITHGYCDTRLAANYLRDTDVDGTVCIECFNGSAVTIQEAGYPEIERREIKYNDDFMACVQLDKRESLTGRAYSGIDEIIAELRAKLNGLVPDSVDLKPCVMRAIGSCVL